MCIRDSGISFESDIRLPQQVEMEDLDIYILLSNLLDNALQHCDMNHPYVKIKGEIRDEYICFKSMNSITESVLQNNPSFITTKSDKDVYKRQILVFMLAKRHIMP